MATALRKSITIPAEENDIIIRYAKQSGMSFSEVLRTAAIDYIRREEAKDLKAYLDEHCEYVDDTEQVELEKIIAAVDWDDEGREIDVNDLLHGKI